MIPHDFFDIVPVDTEADCVESVGMESILTTTSWVEVKQFDTEQFLPFQDSVFGDSLFTKDDHFLFQEGNPT